MKFQSTLPAKGATLWSVFYYINRTGFNPRSPRRERPQHLGRLILLPLDVAAILLTFCVTHKFLSKTSIIFGC